jgi:hypothetical protein
MIAPSISPTRSTAGALLAIGGVVGYIVGAVAIIGAVR